MVTRALEKYLRISPKKLNPIARLISRKNVNEALYMLMNVNKKGALVLRRVIESAVSNAKRIPEKKFTEDDLYISRVIVNSGPTVKRFRAMSMGRAGMIRKRTSHVLIELDASKKTSGAAATAAEKKKKVKKPVKARKK